MNYIARHKYSSMVYVITGSRTTRIDFNKKSIAPVKTSPSFIGTNYEMIGRIVLITLLTKYNIQLPEWMERELKLKRKVSYEIYEKQSTDFTGTGRPDRKIKSPVVDD